MDPVDDELASHLRAVYNADGVDRSLIRASLARTPEERLAELEAVLTFFESATARRASTDDPVSRDPEDAR